MIGAENIVKTYRGREVLSGAGITVEAGKVTCLVGPSGSGKTTLLRVLAGLEAPEQGSVRWGDQNYSFPHQGKISPPWPDVTVVFQSLFLWPHMTLRENILLPLQNRARDTIASELEDMIAYFDMEHFIDAYPNQASLGQRQRVAIARAMMLRPSYILMDEITSALDVEQVHKILTRLARLKEEGIGMLLVTHHLGFARHIADHVCFMSEGKIVEQGSASILAKPQTERFRNFVDMVQMVS